MRETKNIEFKEKVSHTFLKTVSAYCNYGEGKILFGVRDDGTYAGIDNTVDTCLDIENLINANIEPKPDYSLDINLEFPGVNGNYALNHSFVIL